MDPNFLKQISEFKLIPVIAILDANDAKPLGEALIQGGLPVAEVTFRTDCAAEAIGILSKNFPDMLVGAGTVITVDQVKAAADAGARFIVSPGLDVKVVEYCLKQNIPVTPGAITPSEIQVAISLGLDIIKFFPAEAAGGLKYLKAISGPFNKLQFIPTGGINQANIMEYLNFSKVVACGGSWIAPKNLIAEKQFNKIAELTAAAMTAIKNNL